MVDITEEIQNSLKKVSRIQVDRTACIGAGTCVVVSPDGFELDDAGIAIVKRGASTLSDDELIMAAQSCPTQAIILFNSEDKQILP